MSEIIERHNGLRKNVSELGSPYSNSRDTSTSRPQCGVHNPGGEGALVYSLGGKGLWSIAWGVSGL